MQSGHVHATRAVLQHRSLYLWRPRGRGWLRGMGRAMSEGVQGGEWTLRQFGVRKLVVDKQSRGQGTGCTCILWQTLFLR